MLLALLVTACGHDVVVEAAPTATHLTISPASATIDTSAMLQLHSTLAWSDGKDHSADVSFSASGGAVADDGVYHAIATPGVYLIVANCSCGLTDTARVTVVAESAPPAGTASLAVTINGLPGTIGAALILSGPNGFSRAISVSGVIDSLLPGSYTVQGNGVTTAGTSFTAAPLTQAVVLGAGDRQAVAVVYTQVVVVPTGLPPHPRVWMNPDRVARLRVQASANTIRWTRVKSGADAQLGRGVTYTSGDEDKLPDLCAVYLGTGDVRYAQRAGVILTAIAVDSNNLEGDSGYGYRSALPGVIRGYDWCYDGLTVGQRHQVATWMMNRADWVWPETNPARAGSWGVNDPANNYYWGFMMTGPAALAAAGDDTASGVVSGTNRPAYHQQLALHRWSGDATAYMTGAGAGGGWEEGTGYDSSSRLGTFTDAFLTAGIPLVNPWLTASLLYRFHSSTPDFHYHIPFGDQARVSTSEMYAYDRYAALDVLPSAAAGSTMNAQIQTWLARIGQVPTSESSVGILAEELVRYDPSQATASDLSGLTRDYLSAGAGQFIYRSSWTDPNATLWAFESGSLGEGHTSLDANGLMIWKGSFWISASANIYSYSGIEQDTKDYNNLTIGGLGQSHWLYNTGRANTGSILNRSVSDQLVTVRGQASGAYTSVLSFPVSDYVRTVSYLPAQDAFVVVDKATVVDGSQTKTWRWQAANAPVLTGNTFRIDNPKHDAGCTGTVLSPGDITLGTDSYNLGTPNPSSYAVTVSMSGRATDVVVTVLQCGMATAPAGPAPLAVVTGTSATVTIGTAVVVVPLDPTLPVHLQ